MAPDPRRRNTSGGEARDSWPCGRGFQRWYGFHGGETHQFVPALFQDNHSVVPPRTPDEGYHLSEDLADHAIHYLGEMRSAAPDTPVLPLLRHGSVPLTAPRAHRWIDRYAGQFDDGWDAWREQTLRAASSTWASFRHRPVSPHGPPWVPAVGSLAARGPAGRRPVHGVLRRVPLPRRRPDRPGLRVHPDRSASGTTRWSSPCPTTAPAPRAARSARSTTSGCGTAIRPGQRRYGRAWASSAARPPTTTTRGDGRWPATPRSAAGSARSTRAASPTPASCRGRPGIPSDGSVRRQFAHAIDILPTVLDLTGLERPAGARRRGAGPDRRHEPRSHLLASPTRPRPIRPSTSRCSDQPRHLPPRLEGGDVQAIGPTSTTMASIPTRPSTTTGGSCTTWPRTQRVRRPGRRRARPAADLIDLWWEEAGRYQVLPLDNRLLAALLDPSAQPGPVPPGATRLAPRCPRPGEPCRQRAQPPAHVTAELGRARGRRRGSHAGHGHRPRRVVLPAPRRPAALCQQFCGAPPGRDRSTAHGARTTPLVFPSTPTGDLSGRGKPLRRRRTRRQRDIARLTIGRYYITGGGLTCGWEQGPAVGAGYEPPFRFTGSLGRVIVEVEGSVRQITRRRSSTPSWPSSRSAPQPTRTPKRGDRPLASSPPSA